MEDTPGVHVCRNPFVSLEALECRSVTVAVRWAARWRSGRLTDGLRMSGWCPASPEALEVEPGRPRRLTREVWLTPGSISIESAG